MRGIQSVAVIGGGISGLACARELDARDIDVTVFDKGKGPGGRVASRRIGDQLVDYGAQYLSATEPLFVRQLEAWRQAGVAAEWKDRIVRIAVDGSVMEARPCRRYVGTPTMRSLATDLAIDLDVRQGIRVATLDDHGDHWSLSDDEGAELGAFHAVIVATPAPQAVPLLVTDPEMHAAARVANLVPCWAAMVRFDAPLDLDFGGAFIDVGREFGTLAWVAHDSSKPARTHVGTWVLHATPEWSRDHAFYLAASGLGACGDWCRGRQIEDAYLSGVDVAARVLESTAIGVT